MGWRGLRPKLAPAGGAAATAREQAVVFLRPSDRAGRRKRRPSTESHPHMLRHASPTRCAMPGRFWGGWASFDHEHRGLHGAGAEQVQGLLAGVSGIGASDDRRLGFDVCVADGRGVGVEILSRTFCSSICSPLISCVVCSLIATRSAASWSTLRVICSSLAAILLAIRSTLRRTASRSTDIALSAAADALASLAASLWARQANVTAIPIPIAIEKPAKMSQARLPAGHRFVN